jgi:hypothetical protein
MDLNIYNIFESLILESVGRPQIIDAINQPSRVKISYQGEKDTAPKDYVIDPYVYGVSLAGNDIIRAYESKGPSDSKNHDWKTFRVDRILRWEPSKFKLNRQNPVSFNQPTIIDFRLDGGDEKMTSVYAFRKFGDQAKDAKTQQQVDIINKGGASKVAPPINKKVTAEPNHHHPIPSSQFRSYPPGGKVQRLDLVQYA